MTPLSVEIKVLLLMVSVAAGVIDLRSRRIPNWLTVPALLLGLGANVVLGGLAGLKTSLLGFGLALLIYLPLFLLRAMGGGDVKLMAALGAAAGPQHWLVLFVLTALLGGVVALVVVILRGALGRVLRNIVHILGSLLRGRSPHRSREELDIASPRALTMPHGAVIAVACVLYVALAG